MTELPEHVSAVYRAQAREIERINGLKEAAETEAERLRELLYGRDNFIVEKGLWGDFVSTLPHSPSAAESQSTQLSEQLKVAREALKPNGVEEKAFLAWVQSEQNKQFFATKLAARDGWVAALAHVRASLASRLDEEAGKP